jgi:MATE family multidrug resistance protein
MKQAAPGHLKLDVSYRQILSISLPISFSLLVPQFNYLINSFFLARLGPGFLGAAGITGVYYLIFSVIGYGLNNGLQALISRRAGQDRLDEIGVLFVQSIYLTVTIALAGILTTYIVAPLILKISVEEGLYTQSLSFLKIRIWGLPFLYLYQMRNALLVGTNQSKLLIWGTLADTISNVVLDYGLIFGNLGMPKLGFNGAAYASVASEFIGMIAVFFIIQFKGLGKKFSLFADMRLQMSKLKLLFTQSSPLVLQYAISITSWEFFFILISHHGRVALDISQFMRVMMGFFGVFIWAFASTSTTMVSNIIGQGLKEKVIPLINRIAGLSFAVTFCIFIPMQFFAADILGIIQDKPEFIRQGVPVFHIVSAAILLMSFSSVWLNSVIGTGNTRVNLTIEIITIIIYSFYIYFILHKWNMPITWGWGSEWLYWLSMFSMSFWYIRSGRWKTAEV